MIGEKTVTRIVLCCLLGLIAPAFAQDSPADDSAAAAEKYQPPELKYQTGDVLLPNKVATLHLADSYRYLSPGETSKLLVAWGNPPDADTLGAVIPVGVDPFGDEGWAVIVTYLDDGHVDDTDARKIDYNDLLKDMKEGTAEGNKERVDAGYESVEIVGWAEAPHYDELSRKLYWAKELRFGKSDINTLNYDVRVLGREGVLSMNAVAGMPQLSSIERDMKDLLRIASFNEGYRYEDYKHGTDRLAAYGLGALVAGGLAAKAGLFAKIGVMLLAFKKFIIMGLVALGAFFRKLFGAKKAAAGPGA
ncbi:MAG TPA: DUF2167 domain-containing protein [Steroidobacteraceae bacterium]